MVPVNMKVRTVRQVKQQRPRNRNRLGSQIDIP